VSPCVPGFVRPAYRSPDLPWLLSPPVGPVRVRTVSALVVYHEQGRFWYVRPAGAFLHRHNLIPVLVGNVPYNMGVDRHVIHISYNFQILIRPTRTGTTHRRVQVSRSSSWLQVFSPVILSHTHLTNSIRLVFDRETGKPRGYGFCEFAGNACLTPISVGLSPVLL